jgi:protein ImuB
MRFVHLPVELWPRTAEKLAVVDRIGGRRVVMAANEAARAAGIEAGCLLTTALLEEPELRVEERNRLDERRALRALADWSLQFSSCIHVDLIRWLVWIEVQASLRYFGGLAALRSRVEQGVRDLGYAPHIGIAPTLEAAAILASQACAPEALTIESTLGLLSDLDLGLLALGPKVIEQLRATGIKTIGEVLAIPSDAVARRFGPGATDYLKRMTGALADPRKRHRCAEAYRRRIDFADPIGSIEGLLFPLRRVLRELEGYLRGRDVAIQTLEITIEHRDSPQTALTLHTSAPVRDAARLFLLLRERLEQVPWESCATGLAVGASEFLAPEVLQSDFFDDSVRHSAGWLALLDKLRARLGDQSVKQLGLRDDHRPELAWCVVQGAVDTQIDTPFPNRPLWLIEPTPVERPARLLGKPERIEAGWWSGTDSSRDYYLAVSAEGSHWWLYRDAQSGQWFLHGLWA